MALSIQVSLVDDAEGSGSGPNPAWTKPDITPGAHAGWDNQAGDDVWVPDQSYYKRVLLELVGDAGEKPNIVNWELYDTEVYWVAPAATIEAAVDNTAADGKVFAIADDTFEFYVFNGANDWVLQPGIKPPSSLRANGNRVVVELPVYYKWGAANGGDVDGSFLVEAFAPGSFGVPTDAVVMTQVWNPDEGLLTP